jgi:osmotically-inducible protein OsmY
VETGDVVRRAEETARAVPGVAGVVNRLIGADLFEHD